MYITNNVEYLIRGLISMSAGAPAERVNTWWDELMNPQSRVWWKRPK